MAYFCGVSVEAYLEGQQWVRENAEKLREWQGENYYELQDAKWHQTSLFR